MAILKHGTYEGKSISNINLSAIDLTQEEKIESVKFNKDEYVELLEEAKKEGYEEGLSNGYQDGYNKGYNQGLLKFEEDKESLYAGLESDKNNLSDFLNEQSLLYINKFKTDISALLLNSLDRLFLNALDKSEVMDVYVSNLINLLIANYKNFSITANDNTINILDRLFENRSFECSTDNTLNDYDFIILTKTESVEYFLEDEFNKIKELFS